MLLLHFPYFPGQVLLQRATTSTRTHTFGVYCEIYIHVHIGLAIIWGVNILNLDDFGGFQKNECFGMCDFLCWKSPLFLWVILRSIRNKDSELE